jgi:peptidoglycan/LPS O-acetylase OafA/YrhL
MMSLERHGSATIPFYVRRIFRIYPLSIVAVLFFALVQIGSTIPLDIGKLVSNLLLVQNITGDASLPMPLWSLPFEMQMYLVLPALYQITRTRRPAMWAVLLCAASTAFVLLLPTASLARKLALYVPCFLPGVLAFMLARRLQAKTNPAVLFGLIVAVGALGIPVLVAAGLPEMPLLWGLCLALALAIPVCRELQDGHLARGSNLIAKYSYGIYITHVLSLGAIDGLMPGPPIVQWAAMLILLPGLAYICYHGIEKRGIAWGERLAARLASNAAPVSPAVR